MSRLKATHSVLQTPRRREVVQVALEGIISAPTLRTFHELMQGPLSRQRDLLVDLSEITYVNSTALGELVRMHDRQEQQNLALLVCCASDETARLIQMLGLERVLHVFSTPPEALAALDQGLKPAVPEAESRRIRKQIRGQAIVPSVAPPPPKLPEARIVIGVNGDQHLARFLQRCLVGHEGEAEIIAGLDGVRHVAADGVDLAILDSTLPDAQQIITFLKTRKAGGLLSVISIYPDHASRDVRQDFRICEDEFVVEPFEVREIVALALAEFERCRSESILFVQEACMEIVSSDAAITQAVEVLEGLVMQSGLPREAGDGFQYAVREAIDNARRHGNVSDPQRLIEVLYVLDREKITVTVGDEGPGFPWQEHMDKARKLAPVEQARRRHKSGGYGGLGIGLMLRCCDKVEFVDPGNIVKLTKYL